MSRVPEPPPPPAAPPRADVRPVAPPVAPAQGERFAAALAGAAKRTEARAAVSAARPGGNAPPPPRSAAAGDTAHRARDARAEESEEEVPTPSTAFAAAFAAPSPHGSAAPPAVGPGGADGASGTLRGPLSAERVAALIERLDALGDDGSTFSFRVLGGASGIDSLRLVRTAGGWHIGLGGERAARPAPGDALESLERELAAAGHAIDGVRWLDEREG